MFVQRCVLQNKPCLQACWEEHVHNFASMCPFSKEPTAPEQMMASVINFISQMQCSFCCALATSVPPWLLFHLTYSLQLLVSGAVKKSVFLPCKATMF